VLLVARSWRRRAPAVRRGVARRQRLLLANGSTAALLLPMLREPLVTVMLPGRRLLRLEQDNLPMPLR